MTFEIESARKSLWSKNSGVYQEFSVWIAAQNFSTLPGAQLVEASRERFIDPHPKQIHGIVVPVSLLSVPTSVVLAASASLPPRLDLPLVQKEHQCFSVANFHSATRRYARGVQHVTPKSDHFQVRTEGRAVGWRFTSAPRSSLPGCHSPV